MYKIYHGETPYSPVLTATLKFLVQGFLQHPVGNTTAVYNVYVSTAAFLSPVLLCFVGAGQAFLQCPLRPVSSTDHQKM